MIESSLSLYIARDKYEFSRGWSLYSDFESCTRKHQYVVQCYRVTRRRSIMKKKKRRVSKRQRKTQPSRELGPVLRVAVEENDAENMSSTSSVGLYIFLLFRLALRLVWPVLSIGFSINRFLAWFTYIYSMLFRRYTLGPHSCWSGMLWI